VLCSRVPLSKPGLEIDQAVFERGEERAGKSVVLGLAAHVQLDRADTGFLVQLAGQGLLRNRAGLR
jgi:hypothetical protein